MSDATKETRDVTAAPDEITKVDIRDVEEWKEPPDVRFDQRASLEIARWILIIFGGVVLFALVAAGTLMRREDATFETSFDLIKFMIHVILPLATLAVGYYLGDRTSRNDS